MKDVGFNPIVKSFPSNQRMDAKQDKAPDAQGKKTGTFAQILEKNILKDENRRNTASVSSDFRASDDSTEIQSKAYKSPESNEKNSSESTVETKGPRLKKAGTIPENSESLMTFFPTWQQPLLADVPVALPGRHVLVSFTEENVFDFGANSSRIFENEIDLLSRSFNSVPLTGSPGFCVETLAPTLGNVFEENLMASQAPFALGPQSELLAPVNFTDLQAQMSPEVMRQMQSLMRPVEQMFSPQGPHLESFSDIRPPLELMPPTETLNVEDLSSTAQMMAHPMQNLGVQRNFTQAPSENFLSGVSSAQTAVPLQTPASQQGFLELPRYDELEVVSLVFSEDPKGQTFGSPVQFANNPEIQKGFEFLQGAIGTKINLASKESMPSLLSEQRTPQALDSLFMRSLQNPGEGIREEIFAEESLAMSGKENLNAPQLVAVPDEIPFAKNFEKQNEGMHDKESAPEFLNEKEKPKVEKQEEKVTLASLQPLQMKSEELSPRLEEKVRTITQSVVDRAQNLSDQLQARGGGTAKLQLTDKSFGTVNLEIRLASDNRIFIEISSSNEHLRKELESKVDDLKKALESQKLNLADVKISQETTVTSSNTQNSFDSQNQSGQQNAQQQSSNSPFSSGGHGGGGHQPQGFSGNGSGAQQGMGGGFARKSFAHQDAMNASSRQKSVQRGANGSLKVTA